MTEIRFVDTTLRDGQQSVWASRMRTDAMAPVLSDFDTAGFDGAEYFVPTVQFVRMVRQLEEDPWQWLKLGAANVTRTALRFSGQLRGGQFRSIPACVNELLLGRLAELGLRTTRVTEFWNDFSTTELPADIAMLTKYGVRTVLNVIYAVSPRHTIEYYATRTRAAAALRPYRICFKDVGGLLTPEMAHQLLPVVVANAGDVPVEFHGHCQNGFGPYNALIAAESGINVIHTAIPPLANGASQPSIFSVAPNLEARGFTAAIDLNPLRRVSEHLEVVGAAAGFPRGEPIEFDESVYSHQIPGGMISHFKLHLSEIGMSDRFEDVLEEAGRVREELGYPIMVTPLSQFVGTQAVMNVMSGERYSVVSDEVIGYAFGKFGREAVEVMDQEIRELILDRPRTEELEAEFYQVHEEPTLDEVRALYGETVSDEELITRAYTGATVEEVAKLRRDAPPKDYEAYRAALLPLSRLVSHILEHGDIRRFEYRDGDDEVVIERAPLSEADHHV